MITRGKPATRPTFSPRTEHAERHVLLGVSHPSSDPARHRTFEVRATFDASRNGWTARFGEKNLNDQIARWTKQLPDEDTAVVSPTATDCLGSAVLSLIAMVEREAGDDT